MTNTKSDAVSNMKIKSNHRLVSLYHRKLHFRDYINSPSFCSGVVALGEHVYARVGDVEMNNIKNKSQTTLTLNFA